MKRTCGFLVASAVVAWTVLGVRPAAGADEVLSGNIREADNKSGQSTNTGSGIKTNHIQNGAVTSAKIKDGNVLAADLAAGAVTSPKIAAGAVTPGKIAFYSRVIVVDVNGGGDFTSPAAAMTSITDPSGRYLVKLMPGIYDLGATPLQMKERVDLEGSGENLTTIVGSVRTGDPPAAGLIIGASNSEIRLLSASNTDNAASTSVGFLTPQGAQPSLLHVRIAAVGDGTAIAVYNSPDSRPVLTHVTAEAGALLGQEGSRTFGILSMACNPVMTDVTAVAKSGYEANVGIAHFGNPSIPRAVLRRVAATADGPGNDPSIGNIGVYVGYVSSNPAYTPGATLELHDAVAGASGSPGSSVGVMHAGGGASVMSNVTARGGYGMANAGGGMGSADSVLVVADRCTFDGNFASIRNDTEYQVRIGWGKLIGAPATTAGGTLLCVGSYSGSYQALGSNCLVPGP